MPFHVSLWTLCRMERCRRKHVWEKTFRSVMSYWTRWTDGKIAKKKRHVEYSTDTRTCALERGAGVVNTAGFPHVRHLTDLFLFFKTFRKLQFWWPDNLVLLLPPTRYVTSKRNEIPWNSLSLPPSLSRSAGSFPPPARDSCSDAGFLQRKKRYSITMNTARIGAARVFPGLQPENLLRNFV
jgi:hypothetical protein